MDNNLNGILNVYKPCGITSNGVITKIRRLTGIKKVGHTGTLDPEAEGVLPVCIGKATKVAGMLTDADKAYRAVIRLGVTTDSQDMTGNILTECEVDVTESQFTEAVQSFVGEISQIPPMYSAIKQNGQPLYKLARKGIEVERKPRIITVFKINIISFSGNTGVFEVYCSKGTYIRTLCSDIGEKLGCGAAMESLTRIKSGPFEIDKSYTLDFLKGNSDKIGELLIAPDSLFEYEKYFSSREETEKIKHGNPIKAPEISEGKIYRVYDEKGCFLCISKVSGGMLVMEKSFY